MTTRSDTLSPAMEKALVAMEPGVLYRWKELGGPHVVGALYGAFWIDAGDIGDEVRLSPAGVAARERLRAEQEKEG